MSSFPVSVKLFTDTGLCCRMIEILGSYCRSYHLLIVLNMSFILADCLKEPSRLLERITFAMSYGTSTWNMNSVRRGGAFLHKVTSGHWGFQQRSCSCIMASKSFSNLSKNWHAFQCLSIVSLISQLWLTLFISIIHIFHPVLQLQAVCCKFGRGDRIWKKWQHSRANICSLCCNGII